MKPYFPFGICGHTNPPRLRQPRNTEMALFAWMAQPLLMAGGTSPGTYWRWVMLPYQWPPKVRTMLPPLHFSGFLWSCYTSEVSPDSFSNGGGDQQRVLLGSVTLSQCKTLVCTKWLNSHVKQSANQSLPEIMAD